MSYALVLGRGRPRPAAIVALSGFIPTVAGFELDLEQRIPPVAIGHGTFDPVISVEWGRRARAVLEGAGAEVVYREWPLPHVIHPNQLAELASWLDGIAGLHAALQLRQAPLVHRAECLDPRRRHGHRRLSLTVFQTSSGRSHVASPRCRAAEPIHACEADRGSTPERFLLASASRRGHAS